MNTRLLTVLGMLGLLFTVGRSSTKGIANNNPGNLIRTNIDWKGEVPDSQKTDPVFEQFIAPEWGIRAMGKDILNDINKGKDTLVKLLYEYAPPFENDTESYIDSVSRRTGIAREQTLQRSDLVVLVDAIIFHENGSSPFSMEFINYAVNLS